MAKQQPWWREPTRGQWAAFSAAWAGWVMDAFDFTIFLMVQQAIAKEFDVGVVALSGSITLTLLVRLLGGVVAGWMADRWGRKLPLMLSVIWFAAFDAAIYFAPSFVWVVVLRTLFGFGMGAEWTAGTALAMEAWPERSRKIASGLLQAGWPVGFMLAAVVAHFVEPAYGWRAVFLISLIPAVLVFPMRFMIPKEYGGKPATREKSKGMVADLWVPAVRRKLVLGSLVMGLGFCVYYGLQSSYKMMLIGSGFDATTATLAVITFNAGMLVGVVCAGVVANRFGLIAAIVAPALLMVPALPLYVGWIPALLPLGAFLGGALGVGYSGTTPVLTTSLFPEHVRGRAIGFVYHVGAMIGALAPIATSGLAGETGLDLAIVIVAGSALVLMSVAVIVLRREIVVPTAALVVPPAAFEPGARADASPSSSPVAPGIAAKSSSSHASSTP